MAEPLGSVEEGPGGPGLEVLADVEGDDLPEGGVTAAQGVDHEVAEAEAEGEAGGEGPAGGGWRRWWSDWGFGVEREGGEVGRQLGRGLGLVLGQGSAFRVAESGVG